MSLAPATLPDPLTAFLAADAKPSAARQSVMRILDAVRSHLGMDVAFASEFRDDQRILRYLSTRDPDFPIKAGESHPLDESYCKRILEGRLPELIIDSADYPAATELAVTKAIPIGSHLNVPLRLRDGTLYGSFCALSHQPDFTLTDRDLCTLRAFAALAVDQIEQQLDDNRTRDAMRDRIDRAIERETMTLVYQPIRALADGALAGVEALARFDDPDKRSPSVWFAEATEVGRGVELELIAVRQAVRALPYLPRGLYMAFNVAPETLLAPDFAAALADVPEGRLVIEVTEHSRAEDLPALRAALAPLRGRCRLAIDDVGAGYSGLHRILELEPDIIKLDISLTRHIDTDAARRALAHSMVDFAAGIGCRIVAEGIETMGERDAVRDLGIDFGQGYALGRPMPLVAIQQLALGVGDTAEPATPAAPLKRHAAA